VLTIIQNAAAVSSRLRRVLENSRSIEATVFRGLGAGQAAWSKEEESINDGNGNDRLGDG
jgi:hypothetical protein